MAPYSFLSRYTHSNALLSDSKQNGDAAASAAALANEDCPTIDQVLGDERSPATGGLGSNTSRERYPHDRACFLLSAGEFQRTTDGNVRKGRTGQGTGGTTQPGAFICLLGCDDNNVRSSKTSRKCLNRSPEEKTKSIKNNILFNLTWEWTKYWEFCTEVDK